MCCGGSFLENHPSPSATVSFRKVAAAFGPRLANDPGSGWLCRCCFLLPAPKDCLLEPVYTDPTPDPCGVAKIPLDHGEDLIPEDRLHLSRSVSRLQNPRGNKSVVVVLERRVEKEVRE